MNPNISERLRNAVRALNGTLVPDDRISVEGWWDVVVTRADGRIEKKTLKNQVTYFGMNRLANRGVNTGAVTSAAAYLVIGTSTLPGTYNSVQSYIGEAGSGRKLACNAGSTNAQSEMWIALTATWAGYVDNIATLLMDSCAISDYASSSQATGILFNHVNGMGVTLQNSDFLNLTVRIMVGSHNVAHTT